MSKTKHQHVIEGTIKIAIAFDPENLETALQAQADIQAFARQHCRGPFAPGHAPMQMIDVTTRMTKIPVAEEPAQKHAGRAADSQFVDGA